MGKIKGFYKNNRVYVILMGIAVLCLALILFVTVLYFIDQQSGNLYGNRLNGIETVEIKNDKIKSIENSLKDNDKVDHASIKVLGKIIYLNIYLKDGKGSDVKNIAIKSLDLFSNEEKSFYDIAFLFNKIGTEDPLFPIIGHKKSDNSIISWTNLSE